jgi:hypothetical protein
MRMGGLNELGIKYIRGYENGGLYDYGNYKV